RRRPGRMHSAAGACGTRRLARARAHRRRTARDRDKAWSWFHDVQARGGEEFPQARAGAHEPRADRAHGHVEDRRDLAVAHLLEVTELDDPAQLRLEGAD